MRLLSPVFSKEMVTLARRKRHFFSRALFLTVLLATIWLAWRQAMASMQNQQFTDLSCLGHALFQTFTLTQFALVVLLMPALTAPVVAAERDRDTLGLLLMSNLRHHNILLDKLLSRIALMGGLLLSCIPVFLVLLAFGGITVGQILVSYLTIFSTMLFCCGVGLVVSTRAGTMYGALIGTYAFLASYAVGVFVLSGMTMLMFRYGRSPLLIMFLLPVGLFEAISGTGRGVGSILVVAGFPAVSTAVFLLSIRHCARRLPDVATSKGPTRIRRVFSRMNAFFRSINFTGVTIMRENVELKNNPILWRETHKRFLCSNIFLLRSGYVSVILLLLFCFIWASELDFARVVSAIHMLVLTAFAITMSATTFTSEKEKHATDLLFSTTLRSRTLVLSKLAGVLKAVSVTALVPLVLPWINLIPSIRSNGWGWDRGLALLALTIFSHFPIVIIIGMFFSAKCRRSSAAILTTALVILGWYLLPAMSGFMADSLGVSSWLVDSLAYLSPLRWFVHIFSEWPARSLVLLSVPFTVIWILLLLLFLERFDRIVGRQ